MLRWRGGEGGREGGTTGTHFHGLTSWVLLVKVLVQLLQEEPVLEDPLHRLDELRAEREGVTQLVLTVLREEEGGQVHACEKKHDTPMHTSR